MPKLRDLITGDRGLLPYLETTFGTNWNNFQVRRVAEGKLQGFRATSDRMSPNESFGTTGTREQSVVVGYTVDFPGTDGVEAQMVAADFRDTLDRTILEWVSRRPNLVCADVEGINGVMAFQQVKGTTVWVITVVREFSLSYLTD